jgi:FKBP-type peptidyl-prolyl cis-trans isomerase FkpA
MKRVLLLAILAASFAGCARSGGNTAAAPTDLDNKAANVASTMNGQNNAAAPDAAWQTLPSGLRYRRITGNGTGRKPQPTSTVTLHYTGTLQDGTVFDSSLNSGAPVTLSLQEVIPGWQQAVPLMSEGDVYEFLIPPELAYGAEGSPPVIPPNATLRFEVGLLRVDS